MRAVQFYLGFGFGTDRIEGPLNCRGKRFPPPEDPEKNDACEELLLLYEEKLGELDEQIELPKAERIGCQDPEEWQAYVDWAVENGVLPEPVEVDEVMTNEYLPEES